MIKMTDTLLGPKNNLKQKQLFITTEKLTTSMQYLGQSNHVFTSSIIQQKSWQQKL